jgi:hypothetical protein
MAKGEYDDTRAVAQLPGIGIAVMHRRAWDGAGEQLMVAVHAAPSFLAPFRLVEAANPFLFWARMAQALWSPWFAALPASDRRPGDR